MSEATPIMTLNSIRVDKRLFKRDDESEYKASITMNGDAGSITVNLNSEETVAIVNAVAQALANAGDNAAKRLRDSVLASVKTLPCELKPEGGPEMSGEWIKCEMKMEK